MALPAKIRLFNLNHGNSQCSILSCSITYLANVRGSNYRSFHTSPFLRNTEGLNPNFPDEPMNAPRVRRPGRYFAESINTTKYRLGNWPIYIAPAGPQVAFTKRASLGFAALSGYVGYLATVMASVSPLSATLGVLPLLLPIPLFQYFSKPYVTRIYRLYERLPTIKRVSEPQEDGNQHQEYFEEQPDTFLSLTEDETLVVEQVGIFGRSVHATQIKVKDIKIVNERFGWVNWIYKDEETGDIVKMYVADNVGGIKMDRLWGVIERNSGIDNGRGFLNQI